VAVVLPFVAIVELQSAALSLVAGRIRVRRIIGKGKVEAVQRCVAGASVAGEEEPGLDHFGSRFELGQMTLDATITILNFDLAKAVGFERDFQGKGQCPVPIAMQTFGTVSRDALIRELHKAAAALDSFARQQSLRGCSSPSRRRYH
jgi:hypothetical protein